MAAPVITEECISCAACEAECPVEAIYDEPLRHANGQITCVANDRCFPYFSDYYGCSVCIKVCPFNNTPYDKIKAAFQRKS